MKQPRATAGILALLFLSCGSPAQLRQRPLRPLELLENSKNYLNRSVEVEILEPLYGPSSPEMLAQAGYGQVEIRIPEASSANLSLVPQAFKPGDPDRYRHKFDRVVESPLRVRGEFLSDDELATSERRPVYVIRVSSMEPVALAPPEKLSSVNDIKSKPTLWDRKQIVYEGIYESRFEVSSLDGIWLETPPNATVVGRPADSSGAYRSNRVRVTGVLFARPGAHYGHLGGYDFELIASKLEYLGKE